jgi:hypothetical protein
VDPADYGNPKELANHPVDEQSERLKGMAHDKGRFGVVYRFLVQAFDCGHLFSFPGNFKAIAMPP